jgi:hypothetical protein
MAATTTRLLGSLRQYEFGVDDQTPGDGVVMAETHDVSRYDTFTFHALTGAFTVEASYDLGANWTSALGLEDKCTNAITLTTTGSNAKVYGLRMKFQLLRVKQSGGTALTGVMSCSNLLGT